MDPTSCTAEFRGDTSLHVEISSPAFDAETLKRLREEINKDGGGPFIENVFVSLKDVLSLGDGITHSDFFKDVDVSLNPSTSVTPSALLLDTPSAIPADTPSAIPSSS